MGEGLADEAQFHIDPERDGDVMAYPAETRAPAVSTPPPLPSKHRERPWLLALLIGLIAATLGAGAGTLLRSPDPSEARHAQPDSVAVSTPPAGRSEPAPIQLDTVVIDTER